MNIIVIVISVTLLITLNDARDDDSLLFCFIADLSAMKFSCVLAECGDLFADIFCTLVFLIQFPI